MLEWYVILIPVCLRNYIDHVLLYMSMCSLVLFQNQHRLLTQALSCYIRKIPHSPYQDPHQEEEEEEEEVSMLTRV